MNKPQRCFVCKIPVAQPHAFYPGLCVPCGELNHAKREQTADFRGRTALVTGARVKIGYAVALKLLRAGAQVLVTTRFPHDAAKRYAQESDFERWRDRVRIYKLDLRNLALVEQFAQHISQCYPHLDIIVNNAAQTVRRPPAFYRHLLDLEAIAPHKLPPELQPLVDRAFYLPCFDGEVNPSFAIAPGESDLDDKTELPAISSNPAEDAIFFPPGIYAEDGQQLDLRPFNSWLLKDDEVSILEVLEVHVINAIAPFVLNSRLKTLMKTHPESNKYIINVSSMEGRFNGVDKPWRHPHTNMAKASLHMMTRTCAKEYAKHRIYMNCVDPGWISFQHPYPQAKAMQERGVMPPFDFADAAARICDPIFVGINEGRNPFGKFFKDYAEIEW
jgi:NAD(P)-dependent dehydrogenase (short-subunit alcohol dehydrogenase family)